MKTLYPIALVSAAALGAAAVLGAEFAIALFAMIGVVAIAAKDYTRQFKPLPVEIARPVSFPTRPVHALRLAA